LPVPVTLNLFDAVLFVFIFGTGPALLLWSPSSHISPYVYLRLPLRFRFLLAFRIALALAMRRLWLRETNQRFLRAALSTPALDTALRHRFSKFSCDSPGLRLTDKPAPAIFNTSHQFPGCCAQNKDSACLPFQGNVAERSSRALTVLKPRSRLTITRFRSENTRSPSGQY
jgi:hypothetical protein